MANKFRKKLDEALERTTKLKMVGGDKPDAGDNGVKLEGDKEKAADGAHRFDSPTEFTNLNIDSEFKSLPHKYSENAFVDTKPITHK